MQIGATENNKQPDVSKININEIQTNNSSHLSLSACAAFLVAGMEQLFIEEKFKFKNANRRLQGIETGDDDLVIGLFPKEQKPIVLPGQSPVNFLTLEHLFVSNQDGKLANRLSADETTAGDQVIEGFAPDHPGRKTVSKEHKISRVFFCTLQH